jgi:hypothetical protein
MEEEEAVVGTCTYCGTIYEVLPSEIGVYTQNHCSKKCFLKERELEKCYRYFICKSCNKESYAKDNYSLYYPNRPGGTCYYCKKKNAKNKIEKTKTKNRKAFKDKWKTKDNDGEIVWN